MGFVRLCPEKSPCKAGIVGGKAIFDDVADTVPDVNGIWRAVYYQTYSSTRMARSATHRLTLAQREDITRRVRAGENGAQVAREFGVTRAYVSLLKGNPKPPQELTESELAKLHGILSCSTPVKEGIVPVGDRWTPEFGRQLIERLFKKRPGVRAIQNYVAPYLSIRELSEFDKPQPPRPRHVSQISEDLAKNADFVAYYLSPLAMKIAWREYEIALAEWERRQASGAKANPECANHPRKRT
jgi:hypothetical protein